MSTTGNENPALSTANTEIPKVEKTVVSSSKVQFGWIEIVVRPGHRRDK